MALSPVIRGSWPSVECFVHSCSLVSRARLPAALLAVIIFSLDAQVRVYIFYLRNLVGVSIEKGVCT